MKKIVVIVVALIILLGIVLVGGKVVRKILRTVRPESENSEMMSSQTKMQPTPSTMSSMSAQMQEVIVTGSNFAFDPKVIHAKKNVPVKITFKNSGGIHDFLIDEFGVKTEKIQSGEETTVTFTPDKTGTFMYYCSVGNHRAMGMEGSLIVE